MKELEPSAEQMQELVNTAARMVIDYLANMRGGPASTIDKSRDPALLLREPMPESGTPMQDLISILRQTVVDCAVNTAGGTYQAYIPGGGIFSAAVGEFIAAATNRYVGVWQVAPGTVELEATVIRWFTSLVGYGENAWGILTSGGSLANFSAIVAARRSMLPENFLTGTIYASDQVHHSIQKAAILAGFPVRNVRIIPSDEKFRIRVDALSARVEEDRRSGMTPFLIIGSAGTTNTGAVDSLDALADLAEQEKLWFHVDAAYGGFFALTERGRELFRGLERADSITLDPHKGLFLPYGTGCLLARNGEALRRAHQVEASYLQDLDMGPEQINFADYSPELTRSFRGLRAWLPLKLYGAAAFRRYLEEKMELARWACDQLRKIDTIEIIAEPQLSVVAFRAVGDDPNRINRNLLERINATRRTFISSTTIDGQMILRIALLCFRTHREDVENTIEAIRVSIGE
jgi:aromatic-L-amino-acid/L-tryptophan decarboxylase